MLEVGAVVLSSSSSLLLSPELDGRAFYIPTWVPVFSAPGTTSECNRNCTESYVFAEFELFSQRQVWPKLLCRQKGQRVAAREPVITASAPAAAVEKNIPPPSKTEPHANRETDQPSQ